MKNNDMLYLAGLTENFDDSPNVHPGKHPEMCGWYFGMIKMAHGQLSRAVQNAERELDEPAGTLEWLLKEVKEVIKGLEDSQGRAKDSGYLR